MRGVGGCALGTPPAARTVVCDDNLRAEIRPLERVALATFDSHDHLAAGAARRTLSGARLGETGRRRGHLFALCGVCGRVTAAR